MTIDCMNYFFFIFPTTILVYQHQITITDYCSQAKSVASNMKHSSTFKIHHTPNSDSEFRLNNALSFFHVHTNRSLKKDTSRKFKTFVFCANSRLSSFGFLPTCKKWRMASQKVPGMDRHVRSGGKKTQRKASGYSR